MNEYGTEDFDEAVYIDLKNVPFRELAQQENTTNRVLSRRETTVDGRQAVVVE